MADNGSRPGSTGKKNDKAQGNSKKSAHKIVKRPPAKREQGENIIYVTSSSNVKALLDRCSRLIANGANELVVYALGAAIKRGILLALQLENKFPVFDLSPDTFTTQLTDDLEPATDEVDYEIQHRQNSALRIALKRRA